MASQRPQRVKERLLYLDTKQAVHHPVWIEDSPAARHTPGTLAYEGFRIKSRAMPIGDYQILLNGTNPLDSAAGDWLYVESKTWPDLVASMRDSGADRVDTRLRHQLAGLQRLQDKGAQVAVLLVGQLTLTGGRAAVGKRATGVYVDVDGRRVKRNWSYHEVEVCRQAIEHLGIMTAIAPSNAQTPHTLWLLADVCSRDEHFPAKGLPRLANLSPGLGQLATIFTAVEGIGPSTALSIASTAGSFPAFMAMDLRALEQVPMVGKVNAARLWQVFHSERNVNPENIEQAAAVYVPTF